MARTPLTRTLHLAAVLALCSGIGLTALEGPLIAGLGGGDMTLVDQLLPNSNAELRQAAPIGPIDPLAQAEAAAQLTLGLLLIVLGFFIHGLARFREERPVHITAQPPAKRQPSWFWVEMRM